MADMRSRRDLARLAGFLATDEVPESLFGFRVVSRSEDYREEDVRFFREHPNAGGYYDMGGEEVGDDEYMTGRQSFE